MKAFSEDKPKEEKPKEVQNPYFPGVDWSKPILPPQGQPLLIGKDIKKNKEEERKWELELLDDKPI